MQELRDKGLSTNFAVKEFLVQKALKSKRISETSIVSKDESSPYNLEKKCSLFRSEPTLRSPCREL